jgi:hypothetical protein
MAKKFAPPSEFAGYNLYLDKLPKKMTETSYHHVKKISSILNKNVPDIPVIQEVILTPFSRGWGYKGSEKGTNVYVYGNFRSEYKIIVTMAEMLAEYYAQTSYSPIINPVKSRIWKDYLHYDKKFINFLHRQGLTAYSAFYHE